MAKNKFQSTYDSVRGLLFGGKAKKFNDTVDDVLERISTSITDKDSMNYAEMIRNTLASTMGDEDFSNVTPQTIFTRENIERFIRYGNAEEISDTIPYCGRALKVLTDEVVAPDSITKEILNIFESNNFTGTANKKINKIRAINSSLKIENLIHDIVYESLKLGDQFVEFCDYTSDDVPITQSLLNESGINISPSPGVMTHEIKYKEPRLQDGEIVTEEKTFTINTHIVESPEPKVNKSKGKKKDNTSDMSNIRLLVHDPRYVIKIQSNRFRMCLGYLVLPKVTPSSSGTGTSTNMPGGSNISAVSIQSLGQSNSNDFQGIDRIYLDLIQVIKKHVGNKEIDIDKKETMDIITRVIKDIEKTKDAKFNIRFVPPERMEHFSIGSKRFFPYGESIFYKSTFSAKLLIAFETALVIKRISDSSDKRIINVETGLPRNVRSLIEEIKEAMHKRKFSLDSIGTVDSIPSMITSYEEYYIPSKNGRKYVEFDSLASTLNLRDISDELKLFRDMLVAGLEVPPAYLNLEENLCCTLDTVIPLCDGRKLTLNQIIKEHEEGKELYVYSYDHDNKVIFPNKIEWAGKTKLNTNVVRVHLDNEEYIDCTPDHPFLLRDGATYKQAQELQPGESLMPLYQRDSYHQTKRGSYLDIYQPGLDCWILEHQSFALYLGVIDKVNKKYPIHHIDKNPRNNTPDNLIRLHEDEHMRIHSRIKKFTSEELQDLISIRKNDQRKFKEKLDILTAIYSTVELRKCVICSKQFYNRKDINQTTCSKNCRLERAKLDGKKSWSSRRAKHNKKFPLIDRNCNWCGKEFQIRQTSNYIPNKYYACEDKHCKQKIKNFNISLGKIHGKTSSEIDYTTCVTCGKLTIFSHDDKSRVLKNTCRNSTCINTVLAHRGGEKRKTRETFTCPVCDEQFERHQYYIKNSKNPEKMTCGKLECKSLINELEPVLNHKVVRVEILEGLYDTGDITVEKHSNFATGSGVIIHNSNKSALSFENSQFARTIVSYQSILTKPLKSLFRKLYKFTYGESMPEDINITFSPPRMLQAEREAEHFEIVSRIIASLAEQGIDKEYLKKKYLPLDWEEVKKYETLNKLDQEGGANKDEEEFAGGGQF